MRSSTLSLVSSILILCPAYAQAQSVYAQPGYGLPPPGYGAPPSYGPPPCYGPPAYHRNSNRRKSKERDGRWTGPADSIGIRGSLTSFDMASTTQTEGAVSLAAISDGVKTDSDGWARRSRLLAALGGGSAEFEAALDGEIALGWRVPIGREHGPLGRFALEGFVFGNASWYASALYFPKVELGYQVLDSDVLFEVGGHTGLVMAGRYNPGSFQRKLGESFGFGAYSMFQMWWGQFQVDYLRMTAKDTAPDSPLDTIRGKACGLLDAFAVCVDGAYFRGDTYVGDDSWARAESFYGGLMVGYTFPDT